MAKITQYSRISHHTISGSASAGLTFSVPAQEDFTDGTWTAFDLALSEIGVNEQDDKVYIRIDDEIKEFAFIGASGVGFTGGSGSCITDFYTQNIFACDGQVINLRTNDTISTFVDNTIDGYQFTIDAGYSSILLRANNVPLTDICEIELSPLIGSALQISKSDVPTGKSGQINIFSDNIQTIVGDIGVLDTTQINLSLTSSYWEQSDGTFYRNAIDFNTTDILFKAEDITNVLYGELQLTHTVTYFSHYNNGLLSYIQAQDNTIDIQTQGGGALNKVNLESTTETIQISSLSSGGELSDITMISTATPSITLVTQDASFTEISQIAMTKDGIQLYSTDNTLSIAAGCVLGVSPDEIQLRAGQTKQLIVTKTEIQYNTGLSGVEPTNYHIERIPTTNATPTSMYGINFGVTNSVITIEAVVNGWGATNSKAYGAKLFGTFKNAGGTVTQLSTTDKSEKTDFSTATSDFNISGTSIELRVTGEASTDINWASRFNYQISR